MPTPGTNGIIEITTQLLSTDPPRDFCTTHFAVNTGGTPTLANWQALTDAIRGVWFATSGTWAFYGGNGGKVVAYDRADAKPRPEKAASLYTPGSWQTSVSMPRQIAVCVSFYAGRNLKRQRGRVYLPLSSHFQPSGERVASAYQIAANGTIKQIFSAIQALTPSWGLMVHSDADNMDYGLTNVWTNDVFDTQRRRSPKEIQRTQSTLP